MLEVIQNLRSARQIVVFTEVTTALVKKSAKVYAPSYSKRLDIELDTGWSADRNKILSVASEEQAAKLVSDFMGEEYTSEFRQL